jgi:hypothetical protein
MTGGQLLKDIRYWLSPPDSKKNYDNCLASRHSETGTWFINGNTLSEWKSSGASSLLWIHGKSELPSGPYSLTKVDRLPLHSGFREERALVR